MLTELLPPTRHGANVMTIEDPVETALEGASQIEVDRHRGLTFVVILRALFRGSDPDVVYLADLPDSETARLALEVAVTGHLVLAQVSGNSAIEGIQRLREFGLAPRLIAPGLVGAIGVRQARRTCAACSTEAAPARAQLAVLGLSPGDGPFRQGMGCDRCGNSGYAGRIWLTEVLEGEERLSEAIAAEAAAETLWQEWLGQSGRSLRDDALERVRSGHLSTAEAARVLYSYPHQRDAG
jgi:type II secretory ATPase GspE/PulE/Tfp pilus assembly ATPase PilB-like protein